LHFKDTIYAGAGLCDEESVWVLVNEAAANIETLCQFGVNFDRKSNDELALSRKGLTAKTGLYMPGYNRQGSLRQAHIGGENETER